MANPILRVGVIGAGANTRLRHIPGFQAITDVRVVAVCNRSVASGGRVAAEFGISRVEATPDALFADPDIDAICIGTWPYRHAQYAIQALNSGKHVLCEARMAMNAAEAHAMLSAAEAHPDLVAQLVPAPFDLRSWRTIRRVVAEGLLGELREVHVTVLNDDALRNDQLLHWRERVEYSGTNTMTMGIYAEMVHRWLGASVRVVADAATFVDRRENPDTGTTTLIEVPDSLGIFARMANGARAIYRMSTVLQAPRDANGIAIYGTRGTLHWEPADTMTFAAIGGRTAVLSPDPGTDATWQVEADFVTSIRAGAPVELTSFADGLRYMQFTDAVWRSWHERREIDIASL